MKPESFPILPLHSVVTWTPVAGVHGNLPDDELTVFALIDCGDITETDAAYMEAGQWYYAASAEPVMPAIVTHWTDTITPEQPGSNVESAVIAKLIARGKAGRAKYGTSMDRQDLTQRDWLIHHQEELMDAIQYTEAQLAQLPTTIKCRWCGAETDHGTPDGSCSFACSMEHRTNTAQKHQRRPTLHEQFMAHDSVIIPTP